MSNKPSSFPAAPQIPPMHRFGGRLPPLSELPVHALGDSYQVESGGTVQSLPAFPRGTSVFLTFLGSTTLKNSTRLVVQAGADYTFAAGDSALLLSQGDGVWSCFILPANAPQPLTPPQGRVTLASGVPVMSASQAAKTSHIYTPYSGDLIPINDGSKMVMRRFTEMSQVTTDATKSPAAVANSSVYDLFVWDDAGTLRCTRGPAWTNSSTRGYALSVVNGMLVNTSAITNGPAALRGTWVGTIASNGTATIDYVFGAAASGGQAASLMVWNAYNRVSVGTTVTDNGAAYTYSSATPRQARGSSGNQIGFVLGAQEDSLALAYSINVFLPANTGAFTQNGFGFDINSAFSTGGVTNQNPAATLNAVTAAMSGVWPQPAIGSHVLYALEAADGTHANTYGASNNYQGGSLSAVLRM